MPTSDNASAKQRAINFAYGLVNAKAPTSADLKGAVRLLRDTGCDAEVLIRQCEGLAYVRAYVESLPDQRVSNAERFPTMERGNRLWYRPLTNLTGEPVEFVSFNPRTPDEVRVLRKNGRINQVDSGKIWENDQVGLPTE